MDIYEKIIELARAGYHCSQIMMIMILETIGEEDPTLVKTMGGLGGGIGYSGDACGCLTGGACAISYFFGKMGFEDKEDMQLKPAVQELVNWFYEETKEKYGGSDCRFISQMDRSVIVQECPELMAKTYMKLVEILTERGIIEE